MSPRSSKTAPIVAFLRYGTPALLAGGAVLLASHFIATPAFASETCKNVKISVTNHAKNSTGNFRDIKVLKVLYLNGGSWNTELVNNQILTANGGHYTFTEDLGKVKDETTKVKIVFKMNTGGATWSDEHTSAESSSAVCNDGKTYSKDLTGTF